MRIKSLLALLILSAFLLACSDSKTAGNGALTKGVAPIADPEVAVIEMENSAAFGTITIELYSNIAPKMVERFKTLAKEGVYNGTTFHRINDSVIQGGDPNSKDSDPNNDGQGRSDKPNVPAELSDLLYDKGIVGAARGTDLNSANSQFFITLKREPGFDNRYTIFGKVIDGMNNVRTIADVKNKAMERPVEDIRIKTVTIRPK